MLSDTNINLYNRLSEIAALAENMVHSGTLSELSELALSHTDLMTELKMHPPVSDESLIDAIHEADKSVKRAITAIQEKQKLILEEISASNNRQLLNRAYGA